MSKINKLSNKDLLNELLSLYSKDENYKKYYSDNDSDLFNDKGKEYERILREEILSRMVDSNAENFMLFGVKNEATGKLVSNITNPRHKYWESEKKAQSALDVYTSRYKYYDSIKISCRETKKYANNPNDMRVVKIKCTVE